MARIVKERCPHCNKVMRNDNTEQESKWVCNNPKCVCYEPPKDEDNEDE